MSRLGTIRNTVLSTAYFLRTKLDAEGWSGVGILGELPDNYEIVPADKATGSSKEVVIPALQILEFYSMQGQHIGIGEPVKEQDVGISVVVYAETPGQERALRSFIESTMDDYEANFYDFSDYGYPPASGITASGLVRFTELRSRPNYNYGNVNAAARYGGIVMATARTLRQQLNS
jgi:hypothetical protein